MGPRISNKPDQWGFTLIEVMAALTIVAALLVTLAFTTNYNLDLAGRHEALTVATMLARDKMTEVGNDTDRTLKDMKGSFDEPFEGFTYDIVRKDKTVEVFGFPISMLNISVTVEGRRERVVINKQFSLKVAN